MGKNLENITYFLVIIAVFWYLTRSTSYGEYISDEIIVKPFHRKLGL